MLLRTIRSIQTTINNHTSTFLLLGLAGVAWHNWRLWQRDRALAQRVNRSPLPSLSCWSSLPEVSFLVAAWNESAHIDEHIRSFLALRYPYKQLVLCAGGSDDTLLRARGYCDDSVVILEQQPGEGKQRALRRCLDQATGEIIFLTDADCVLDNDAIERTLYPVASDEELVCTGGARPLEALMTNPFVVAQAVSDLRMYSDDVAPDYLPGLLGRNCAIKRTFLERSGGLDAPAPTGTDYVLAKELVRSGARIRQVRSSQIATEYAVTPRLYIRQRRRWLRNIAFYGRRYGASADVRASLTTSMVGVAMLALPLTSALAGVVPLLLWICVLLNGLLTRLRYLRFAQLLLGLRITWRHVAALVVVLVLDFVAWSAPLLDYCSSRKRTMW